MVVAAHDAPSLGQGFGADANLPMPLDEYDALPPAADVAVPSVLPQDAAAATVPSDVENADPQVALRAEVEADLRPQIEAEYLARFGQDKANLQRVHAQQLKPLQDQVNQYSARERAWAEWAQEKMGDLGLDEREQQRELAVLESKLNRGATQARTQQQQLETGFTSQIGALHSRHLELNAQMEQQFGNVLTDADRAEFEQKLANVAPLLQRHWMVEGGQPGTFTEQQAMQYLSALKQEQFARAAQRKTEADATAAQAAQRQRAEANRQKAAERGPQSTAVTGGGGGAGNPAALTAESWQLYPKDQAARLKHVLAGMTPATR